MKDLEESLLGRRKGLRIVKISLAIGLVGVLPLLLYIAAGREDGNPIGLGLLAVLAVPTATIGVLIGLIKLVVEALGTIRSVPALTEHTHGRASRSR